MSFILDALRKSESERQREASPSLSRAPLAIVRHRIPIWTWFLIGLLLLALLALTAAWWRSDESNVPTTAQSESPSTIVTASPSESQPTPIQESAVVTPPRVRSIAELATLDPNLPSFRLEVLAYNGEDPTSGSAWINGRRYFIGERVVGGPELVEVRSDGVVLAYASEHFLLTTR